LMIGGGFGAHILRAQAIFHGQGGVGPNHDFFWRATKSCPDHSYAFISLSTP
jgi:hypothetical protein